MPKSAMLETIHRWAVVAGLLALAVTADGTASATGSTEAAPAGPRARRLEGPFLEPALRAALVRSIEAHGAARYALEPDGPGRFVAREDGVGMVVSASGVELLSTVGRARLGLRAIGRPGALAELAPGVIEAEGNAARVEREGSVERWVHGPLGLEHLLDLAARPSGEGPVIVELEVSGALRPRTSRLGSIELVDAAGAVRGRYEEAWAEDAAGRPLAMRLSADGRRITLVVDDRDARYPIAIDPVVWLEQAAPLASDGAAGDGFGYSVAIEANRAVVGAYSDDVATTANQGSAYVLVRTGSSWVEEQRLVAFDGAANDYFGRSVAIEGSRIVVGAPQNDSGTDVDEGSAYVFARVGAAWVNEDQIVFGGAQPSAAMGTSVAISGDTILLGAPNVDGTVTDQGRAYVFTRTGTTWGSIVTLSPPAAGISAFDFFGESVALVGDVAVVGAYRDDVGAAANRGSVFVFRRTATVWGAPTQLLASDGVAEDNFGASVAFDGTTIVVGAYGRDVAGRADQGVAFVFSGSGTSWAEQAILSAAGGAAGDRFGAGVALSGPIALVGTVGARGAVAFLRAGTTWAEHGSFLPSAGSGGGDAVALSGDTAIIGNAGLTVGTEASRGGAFIAVRHPRNAEPCTTDAMCGPGTCVDGLCCFTACGGGPADCQACAVAAGGTRDGTCTALDATTAPTVACRPSGGPCDVEEVCSAASPTCPSDTLRGAGVSCRPAVGTCDDGEVCSGTSTTCPADVIRPVGTVCQLRGGAECDEDDVCDGSSGACPPRFASPTTTCGPPASDVCDAPDRCAGTSADCIETFVSGVSCRVAAGSCDLPEVCSGTAAGCPPDDVLAAGSVCRASVETCDPAEVCDGTGVSCPADATTCGAIDAGPVDAGPVDAAPAPDAASAGDAGAPPSAVMGCACHLGAGAMRAPLGLFTFMAALAGARLLRARERRRL